jgi:hypothetical protein
MIGFKTILGILILISVIVFLNPILIQGSFVNPTCEGEQAFREFFNGDVIEYKSSNVFSDNVASNCNAFLLTESANSFIDEDNTFIEFKCNTGETQILPFFKQTIDRTSQEFPERLKSRFSKLDAWWLTGDANAVPDCFGFVTWHIEKIRPVCLSGQERIEICLDDSVINSANCISGRWVSTNEMCPIVEPKIIEDFNIVSFLNNLVNGTIDFIINFVGG